MAIKGRPIDHQIGNARVGKIRMGERKKPNRPGFQRDTFRFTSSNKAALEMLLEAYGGTISKWDEHPGEWELDSNAGQIRVLLDTTLSVDDNYEKYDGKSRTHLCDGIQCNYFEIKRDGAGKITFQKEHGLVPCLCNSEGHGPDPDNDDDCYLKTDLRVILPDTGDIMLWEFSSKGKIFNKEVLGAMNTFRSMGLRQGYCHLSINRLEKVRGNEVNKFGVARLTLDPNPPNFVAQLMSRTPEAQAKALMMGTEAAAPQTLGGNTARELPASTQAPVAPSTTGRAKAMVAVHEIDKDQFNEIAKRAALEGESYIAFLEKAQADGHIGYIALLKITSKDDPAAVTDPFAKTDGNPQGALV